MAYVTFQENGATHSIINALSSLTKIKDIDTIILVRGGGPSEDFMAFNDEELVRAIALSIKPLITGIGHEKDTCLADLVSDFRASTPSTAAKAAIPDIHELRNGLLPLKQGLDRSYKSYLLAVDAREKEAQAKRVELQKLRNNLNYLNTNLDRSYEAHHLRLKIREKDEEIKQAESKQDLIRHNAMILALIALLVLIIIILLFRG